MKLVIRKIIKYFLILPGILYTIAKGNKNEILILMYHRINDGINKELCVKKSNFCWHMNYLKRKNYRVISMDEAYERIVKRDIAGRSIVLTFDDGYEDYYLNAYPVLKEKSFPSLVYLVPGFIETNKVYWWDRDLHESRLMNWSQISELNNSGMVDFGSHSFNHYDMNCLDIQQIRCELDASKKILENTLGKSIKHFSYPRGIYTQEVENTAKELYDTGSLIINGRRITTELNLNDLWRLKRIPVQNSDGKYLFAARIKGWLSLEEFIKKLIYHTRGRYI